MIVDDEPLARDILNRYIESVPDLTVGGIFDNATDAFAALQKQKIDLLFLDIQMPGLSGIELIKVIKNPPCIILTTAFREFAIEGFELDVMDYLVKPISKERFLKSIDKFYGKEKISQTIDTTEEPFVFIKVDKEMVKLKLDEILFIEALKNYSRIKTAASEHIVYYTLSHLEDKLPVNIFKRIHKSFIVNLNQIIKFNSSNIEIAGKIIPIGQSYQQDFERALKKYKI
jgi:DNA-binding LytR/AlgR family response regulator